MEDFEQFRVKPGRSVKLSKLDPAFVPHGLSKADAETGLGKLLDELGKLQYRLYAEHRQGLLVVLQGIDGAGKDGSIRHVMTGMNPAGCVVTSFKQPTRLELDHDFLWRVHPHVPARGDVAVFNRSHYEDVLVVRVHHLVPKDVWSARYALINDFERLLREEAGTRVVKFFLHISKEEQLKRFEQRLEDPERQWKIAEEDYKERVHWDEYLEAYQDVLEETSTRHAPWYVVPSDRKWMRNLMVAQVLVDTLRSMKIQAPKPTVDLHRIRAAFHEASAPGARRKGKGKR